MTGDTAGRQARPAMGWLSRRLEAFLLWFYRRQGWQSQPLDDMPAKAVIIAAPHTSNWDFVYTMGLTRDLGIETSFMAKQELFGWPLGGFMRDMGGVAVNRARGGNYVQAMIDEFAARDQFLLIIAPEGTRRHAGKWKTGFYHIAMGAGVPIILGMLDYGKKAGGLAFSFMPTGDFAADMAQVEQYYHSVTARHPERMTHSIVAATAADRMDRAA